MPQPKHNRPAWIDHDVNKKKKKPGPYWGAHSLWGDTPRQFGRRVGCGLSCLVIVLQITRIYLRQVVRQQQAEQEAWMKTATKIHYENHTCHTRGHPPVESCSPIKCARAVIDDFISHDECMSIISLADFGMSNGGGQGGATILDLPSGALSLGNQFINLHALLQSKNLTLPEEPSQLLKRTMSRVRHEVSRFFGVNRILGTAPRFISRMDQKPAKTMHDEYWHEHVDSNQYPGFEYTALLYLNEQGKDYGGGRFSFVDPAVDAAGQRIIGAPKVSTIQPKCGRLVFFTSGPENVHKVHQVESGQRYALTIAFTCDDTKALTGEWDPPAAPPPPPDSLPE